MSSRYLFAIKTDGGMPVLWKKRMDPGKEYDTIVEFFNYIEAAVTIAYAKELERELLDTGMAWFTQTDMIADMKDTKCQICLTAVAIP